jgi:hypothetical protein
MKGEETVGNNENSETIKIELTTEETPACASSDCAFRT